MTDMNRREFVERAALTAGVLAVGGPLAAEEAQKERKITDKVKIGKTGITSSLLGIGTGSIGWNKQSNQTRLGHKKFNELMEAAWENGIRFFDVADQYGSHPYLKEALTELKFPRKKFIIHSPYAGEHSALSDDALKCCAGWPAAQCPPTGTPSERLSRPIGRLAAKPLPRRVVYRPGNCPPA